MSKEQLIILFMNIFIYHSSHFNNILFTFGGVIVLRVKTVTLFFQKDHFILSKKKKFIAI